MSISKYATLAGAAALALTASAGSSWSQDKVKLVFAASGDRPAPRTAASMDHLADQLSKRSDGRITIEYHWKGTLCAEHTCVEQARQRLIDMTALSSGNMGAFGTTLMITDMPYIFKDTSGAKKVLDGWMAGQLREQLRADEGVQMLGIFPSGGFRNIQNNLREVRKPADLKGMKLRVTKSPAEFGLVTAWGGVAIPYDWSQMYEGLSHKVVNGMYIPDPWFHISKLYEVAPYLSRTGGAWAGNVMVMDKERFDDLPGSLRDAIMASGDFVKEKIWEYDEKWIAEVEGQLRAKKVKIYEPTQEELKVWRSHAHNGWSALKGRFDPKMARRALLDQGMTDLIKILEEKGLL